VGVDVSEWVDQAASRRGLEIGAERLEGATKLLGRPGADVLAERFDRDVGCFL